MVCNGEAEVGQEARFKNSPLILMISENFYESEAESFLRLTKWGNFICMLRDIGN
jgi:hypothetical protein